MLDQTGAQKLASSPHLQKRLTPSEASGNQRGGASRNLQRRKESGGSSLDQGRSSPGSADTGTNDKFTERIYHCIKWRLFKKHFHSTSRPTHL